MGFEPVKRRGSYWEDVKKIDEVIKDFPFHTTGKCEKDFENGFSTALMAMQSDFENEVITQIDKTRKVKSVFCFGKNNRPDLTISKDGIAFEIKYFSNSSDGFNEAIGQGYLYRLQYKFVFIILVIGEKKKDLYYNIAEGKEKNMEDILYHLSKEMNIFTYIVPAFEIKKPGTSKCLTFFK
jgi:hypothetical protein